MADVILMALGNTSCADDGFGPKLLNKLQQDYQLPANLQCIDAGTAPLGHYHRLTRCRWLILLDALRPELAGQDTDIVLLDSYQPSPLSHTSVSCHDLRADSLLQLLAAVGQLPRQTSLLGAVANCIGPDQALSPGLQALLPQAISRLVELLQQGGIKLSKRYA